MVWNISVTRRFKWCLLLISLSHLFLLEFLLLLDLYYLFGKILYVHRYYVRSTLKYLRSKFCNILCGEIVIESKNQSSDQISILLIHNSLLNYLGDLNQIGVKCWVF